MAEEAFFSVEKTLIDLLRFVRKIVVTSFYCLFLPAKVIDANIKLFKNEKPANNFTHYFAYFVICILITVTFYRVILLNNANGVKQSIWDIMVSGSKYLFNNSIYHQLLPCLLYIFVNHLIIFLLTRKRKDEQSEKELVRFAFRKTIYYFQGTMFLIWLFPLFTSTFLPLEYIDVANISLIICYTIYCCYSFYGNLKKIGTDTSSGLVSRLTMCMIGLLIIQTIAKVPFKTGLRSSGYLTYTPSVILLNENGKKELAIKINRDSGTIFLSGIFMIQNNDNTSIVLDPGSLKLFIPDDKKENGRDTIILRTKREDSTAYIHNVIDQGKIRSFYFYSAAIDSTIISRLGELQKEGNSSLNLEGQLFYIPEEEVVGKRMIRVQIRDTVSAGK
jgi:hypothetical protein